MRRLSAAVVMYGGAEEVVVCLESLVKHTKQEDLRVYVIDNASPDNAYETVYEAGLPCNVEILPQKTNRGFGSGHNVVLPFLDSRYHAVVNPDIQVFEDVLTRMADWMDKNPDVVITIPRLVFPSGEPQYVAKRRPAILPLLSRQLGWKRLKKYEDHYLMRDVDLTKPTDVTFCSGSFFMIRTEAFVKMGGFDEKYFMYVEDADITQKALELGRAVYLPDIAVVHKWHREAHKKPRQFFWQLKSMLRYFCKWGFRWK